MPTNAPARDPLAEGMAILERARQHFSAPADRAAIERVCRLLYESEEGAWHDFCVRAMKEWDDARKFEKYRLMALDRKLRSRGLIE